MSLLGDHRDIIILGATPTTPLGAAGDVVTFHLAWRYMPIASAMHRLALASIQKMSSSASYDEIVMAGRHDDA